jgi:hypothetical protein
VVKQDMVPEGLEYNLLYLAQIIIGQAEVVVVRTRLVAVVTAALVEVAVAEAKAAPHMVQAAAVH